MGIPNETRPSRDRRSRTKHRGLLSEVHLYFYKARIGKFQNLHGEAAKAWRQVVRTHFGALARRLLTPLAGEMRFGLSASWCSGHVVLVCRSFFHPWKVRLRHESTEEAARILSGAGLPPSIPYGLHVEEGIVLKSVGLASAAATSAIDGQFTAMPEPGTLLSLASGMTGFFVMARMREN